MIIISDVAERKNSKGENFVALILTGSVEMIKSKIGGKFYATVRKASVPSTLSLKLAKQVIGTRIQGMIVKKPCTPYMFKTQSGEEIELDWTYEYTDDAANLTEEVFQ
jgi:hypothetical protein